MRTAELIIDNLDVMLIGVVIPLLLMVIFTVVRKMSGNTVTAMPDVLVFLATMDFIFAVQPDPWIRIVHPVVKTIFPPIAFTIGLFSVLIFLYSLRIEKRINDFWVCTTFPQLQRSSNFPYLGFLASWISIAFLIAVNIIPFSGKYSG